MVTSGGLNPIQRPRERGFAAYHPPDEVLDRHPSRSPSACRDIAAPAILRTRSGSERVRERDPPIAPILARKTQISLEIAAAIRSRTARPSAIHSISLVTRIRIRCG